MFKEADADGDGKLSVEEVVSVVDTYYTAAGQHAPSATSTENLVRDALKRSLESVRCLRCPNCVWTGSIGIQGAVVEFAAFAQVTCILCLCCN